MSLDYRYLHSLLEEAMPNVSPNLPFTGRFRGVVAPEHISRNTSHDGSITLEIHNWAEWWNIEKDPHIQKLAHNCGERIKLRLCVPGFRGAERSWFPHPDYSLIAPIPATFVRGRFAGDLFSSTHTVWEEPYLTAEGQNEFDRLGISKFKLMNAFNRKSQRPLFLMFAAFQDTEQWMTAKMRFTSQNPA